jgi:hypothetical protein
MKINWVILLSASINLIVLGSIIGLSFRKTETVVDFKAIQEALMQQYKSDSVKYTRIMNAMAYERKIIDSLYSLKQRNYDALWKKFSVEAGRIRSLSPDSSNLFFSKFTDNPPCW